MQLRTAGPRIPANDLELPQHPSLLQRPSKACCKEQRQQRPWQRSREGGKFREVEEGEEPCEAEESQEPEVEQEGDTRLLW